MKAKLFGAVAFASAAAITLIAPAHAYATNYRFFCTNQSDPAINPDHDGVFVAITYGTAQSFDVVHTISGQLYSRQVQYRVTSITQPATNSYFWEGFMLKDPNVIMTGHLWQNEGVWMYTENQRFTDGRSPKLATPPVVCHNTVDRQAVERDEQPTVRPGWEPLNPQPQYTPPPPTSPSPQFAQEAPATDCDTYAASPFEPQPEVITVPFAQVNPALAVPACEVAVRQYPNSIRLAFQLGRAYQKANNFTAALEQYRKAAAQNYALAQNNLGVMYENGLGVPKDIQQAIAWYRKAAEQGLPPAQETLRKLSSTSTPPITSNRGAESFAAAADDTHFFENYLVAHGYGGCGNTSYPDTAHIVADSLSSGRDSSLDLFGKPAVKWSDDDIAMAIKVFSDCEAKVHAPQIDFCVQHGHTHDRSDCERRNPIRSQSQSFERELRRAVMTARGLDAQKKAQQQAKIELEKIQAETRRAQVEEEAQRKEQELRAQAQRDKEAAEEARRAAEREAPKIAEATKEAEEARRALQDAEQRLATVRAGIAAQERVRNDALARSQAAATLAERSEGRLSEPDAAGQTRRTAPPRAAEADPLVYAGAMGNAVPTMARAMNEIGTTCGVVSADPATWDRCASAIEIGLGSIRSVQTQMSALAVPDCFENADRMLRHALDLLDQGYSTTRNGILARSIPVTQTGMHEVENGNQELNKVTEVLKSTLSNGTCTAARGDRSLAPTGTKEPAQVSQDALIEAGVNIAATLQVYSEECGQLGQDSNRFIVLSRSGTSDRDWQQAHDAASGRLHRFGRDSFCTTLRPGAAK